MKLYTTSEAANILKIDQETVRDYIRTNKIRAYKIGSVWRIKEEDLIAFVEKKGN